MQWVLRVLSKVAKPFSTARLNALTRGHGLQPVQDSDEFMQPPLASTKSVRRVGTEQRLPVACTEYISQ